MTTPLNLEEAYNELSNLLKDVRSFLNSEVQNGALNATAANHAQKLVQRLKKQEEVISKISALQESTNSNYPYLQMQGPGLVEEPLSEYVDADGTNHYEEDYEETENYALIENEQCSLPPPSIVFEDSCPYLDLPLSQLENEAIKHGPLIRKERYFIIEKKMHLIVGLIGYWLLIYYTNKKDMKPQQAINLTEYRAQPKKDPAFEIFCENKKSYEFIAKSAKDMDQWIVAINCKKLVNPNARNLPSVPSTVKSSTENMSDTIDQMSSNNTNNNISLEEPEDIYENVDDLRKTESSPVQAVSHENTAEDDAPKLPDRQATNFTRKLNTSLVNSTYNNIPVSPNIEEEEDNTYDPVQNGEIEEDEDEIYDEPKLVETFDSNLKLSAQDPNKKIQLSPQDLKKQLKELKTQTNDYDNEEDDENCSYDIPRSDNFNQVKPSPQTFDEYEDEDVEYDELRIIPQNNNEKIQSQQTNKVNLKIDKTPEKTKSKPGIISPKPKLQGRLAMAFSRKSDNTESSQEGNNSKRIHNIIQQMEATLTFKAKN